jgi:hypothetical protein
MSFVCTIFLVIYFDHHKTVGVFQAIYITKFNQVIEASGGREDI